VGRLFFVVLWRLGVFLLFLRLFRALLRTRLLVLLLLSLLNCLLFLTVLLLQLLKLLLLFLAGLVLPRLVRLILLESSLLLILLLFDFLALDVLLFAEVLQLLLMLLLEPRIDVARPGVRVGVRIRIRRPGRRWPISVNARIGHFGRGFVPWPRLARHRLDCLAGFVALTRLRLRISGLAWIVRRSGAIAVDTRIGHF